jgi:type IV pilus assembly protein PilV
MNMQPAQKNKQRGVMLLEALISILIFSLGILAIIGLQAASIKNAGDAKYRTDASLLANGLIAEMWASDRTQTTLQNNYTSPNGNGYLNWRNNVMCPVSAPVALPGVDCVNNVNLPTVAISAVTTTSAPSNLVTVTIFWQAPGAASGVTPHQFTAISQIVK